MPARRRFPDSESDDNQFTALIVDESDEKKKYSAKPKWNLSSISGNINNYIQQQLVPGGYALITSTVSGQYSQQNPTLTTQTTETFFKNNSEKDLQTFADEPDDTEIVVMTARDRTVEFSNAIRSLQSRNIARAVNIRDPRKATQMQSYSEFMMIARHVGKNIASTYTKLEKLTLCKIYYPFLFT